MSKLVLFVGRDEVIVTTKKNEDETVKEYFAAGTGREMDDYDREEPADQAVVLSSRVTWHF